jgi:hypothetical protein
MEKAECSENIVYCVKMEKLDLLKLFQEWGGRTIRENDGEGKHNYDILQKLLYLQYKNNKNM